MVPVISYISEVGNGISVQKPVITTIAEDGMQNTVSAVVPPGRRRGVATRNVKLRSMGPTFPLLATGGGEDRPTAALPEYCGGFLPCRLCWGCLILYTSLVPVTQVVRHHEY